MSEERDRAIYEAARAGQSFVSIADDHGVSDERVRHIAGRLHVDRWERLRTEAARLAGPGGVELLDAIWLYRPRRRRTGSDPELGAWSAVAEALTALGGAPVEQR